MTEGNQSTSSASWTPDPEQEGADAPAELERPDVWTSEWVCHRLVDACRVIDATTAKGGPKKLRTAWPQMAVGWQAMVDEEQQIEAIEEAKRNTARAIAALRKNQKNNKLTAEDAADIEAKIRSEYKLDWRTWRRHVDARTIMQVERDASEAAAGRELQPPANEIDLAMEAALWPLKYLQGDPLASDALMLWTVAKAFGRRGGDHATAKRMLHARAQRIDGMVAFRQGEEDARYAADRKRLACGVAALANDRLGELARAGALSETERHKIAEEAHAWMRVAIADLDALAPRKVIRRQDIEFGKVFSPTHFNRCRHEGARIVCAGLVRDRVAVR